MRTVVYPSAYGGRTRTAQVPARPLSAITAAALADDLAKQGVVVAIRLKCTTVHLFALADLSTAQEVEAIRAFAAVTDARIAWHKAGAA